MTKHINSLRFRLKKKGKLVKYETRGKAMMQGKPHLQESSSASSTSSEGEE